MTDLSRYLLFILMTPIFFLLGTWVSVFPHEYAHATVAWWYGFKDVPWDIYYGHFTWKNVLFVSGIDENVNYYLIYLLGYQRLIGWISFAGPGIATVGIYFISLLLLQWEKVKKHPYWFYLICWINVINIAELVSYVFLRAFSAHGDMGHIVFSWQISPWWIFFGGGLPLTVAIWYFFANTLPELYSRLQLNKSSLRAFLLVVFAYLLFGHSGIRMFLDSYGTIATVLGVVSCITMVAIIIICWPSKTA